MSRHLQLRLHAVLQTATATLDLPLDAQHLERLAAELTPAIKAMLAEADATIAELAPVPYEVSESDGVEVTEFAGCITRTSLDVDLDSPAGTVAYKARRQPDVTAVEIRDAFTIALTVDPQSLDAWRWWLHQFGIDPRQVTLDGATALATGSKDGATVHLRGDGVPDLLVDRGAARLMGLIAEPATP